MTIIFKLSHILMLSVTCICAITDLYKRKVPNYIILPALGLALIQCIVLGWITHLRVAAIVTAVTYVLFIKNVISGGDVKLLIYLALSLGKNMMQMTMHIAYFSVICIVIFYVVRFVNEKILNKRLSKMFPVAVPVFLAVLKFYSYI